MINLELLRRNKGTIFILEKYLVLYNQGRRCQREEDTNAPVTDKYIHWIYVFYLNYQFRFGIMYKLYGSLSNLLIITYINLIILNDYVYIIFVKNYYLFNYNNLILLFIFN